VTAADVIAGRAEWAVECGDCLALLSALPDACVDAVITDPPYNVGFEYRGTNDRRINYEPWCAAWLAECRRVVAGPIAVSCGTKNMAMWCRIREPHWVLCWWKPACMGNSPVGACNWEPVLLYGKSHRCESCDVVRAPIKPSELLRGHPCPKPLAWALGLTEALTLSGQTVLDPFVGSGTTGVACLRTGRRFIGFDVEPAYCDLARQRLGAAPPLWTHAGAAEPGLFDPPAAEVTS
jgi:site-specific DNA-methyltransferase (adenine-specific)